MFIQLAEQLEMRLALNGLNNAIGAPTRFWDEAVEQVFQYRPVDLLNYLEGYWAQPAPGPVRPRRGYVTNGAGSGGDETARQVLAEPMTIGMRTNEENIRPRVPNVRYIPFDINNNWYLNYSTFYNGGDVNPNNLPFCPPVWKHMIYAYAVENTRVLDILQRVLREIITGERLGRPNARVLSWARNTEELFFTDRLGHWIFSPVSRLRDDAGAIRRNAYFRMLGMDLNHGSEDGSTYPFVKPAVANREFTRNFEQLLREVWRGYVNRNNVVGPNLTDDAAIYDLVQKIRDMLRDRRLHGTLAREEFYCVAALSWFHLTVSNNNELVIWLKAQGNNASERLRGIGELVGLAPHTRAYNFFEMADALSEILLRIEDDEFNLANVRALYCQNNVPITVYDTDSVALTGRMIAIINNWSSATGRNLKEPGQYLPETSLAMSRSMVQQGGNGYHSLAKVK